MRLVRFEYLVRRRQNLREETGKTVVIGEMTFPDMRNLLFCDNNIVCDDVWRDAPIKVNVNFTYRYNFHFPVRRASARRDRQSAD